MSINISNIEWVGPTTTPWSEDFRWQISLDCIQELRAYLEWKVVYVGSASDTSFDQILECIPVGPIPVGSAKFELAAPPPDPTQIPTDESLGATCVLLSCSYVNQEFITVGFFLSNEYDTKEMNEHPPSRPNFSRMVRNIAAAKPKVTRYVIDWTLEDPDYEKDVMEINQQIDQIAENESGKEDREFLRTTHEAFQQSKSGGRNIRRDFLSLFPSFISKKIFSYLDLVSLAKTRQVSPDWKKIVDAGLDLEVVEVNSLNVEAFEFAQKQSSAGLISLCASGTEITDSILSSWLSRSGKNLKAIYLENCKKISEKSVEVILEHCPVISSLFVSESPLSKSESIHKIFSKVGGNVVEITLDRVSSKDLQEIIKVCGKQLETLALPHSTEIDDSQLAELVNQCPHLSYLNVAFCPQLSAEGVEALRKEKEDKLEIVASVSPDDFTAELSKLEVKPGVSHVRITFKVLDQFVSPSLILPFLEEVPQLKARESDFVFEGSHAEANKVLSDLGFEVETIGDWEENLDDESESDEDEEGEEAEGEAELEGEDPDAPTESKRQKVE